MKWLWALGAGAVGGAAAAGLVWYFADKKLNQSFEAGSAQLGQELGMGEAQVRQAFVAGRAELQATVRREVQHATVDAIRAEMDRYGVTPERIRQLNAVLARAESMGLV